MKSGDILLITFLVFFVSSGAFGHIEDKEKEERGINETEELSETEINGHQSQGKNIFELSRLFEHMHNKVVHFPIACGVVSALFEIISFKLSYFSAPANVLLGITSLSAFAAFLSGKSIEEEYEEEIGENNNSHKALELHETFGFITMIFYSLAFVLKFIPKMQKIGSTIVILMLPVLGITGYLGGFLAH